MIRATTIDPRAPCGRWVLIATWLVCAAALSACGSARTSDSAALANEQAALQANLAKAGPLGDMTFGRADAPVTIIEYASLTCPYCRQFHAATFPRLKREYIDTGKVRFVIREFPIGRTAGAAAIVTRCAPKDKYLTLYHKFLAQQATWVSQDVRPDAIYKVAAQTGMTRETFDKCLANQKIEAGLKLVKEQGRALDVVGTPTFFVNGEKASGALTFEQIKAMIEPQSS